MKNLIFINTNLITNFKPEILKNFNNYKSFRLKKKQILCKNFFIYILLLKYKYFIFKKSNIFIKKKKTKVFTILRSPYRHKLARHQININRYFINVCITIKLKKRIELKNWKSLLKLLNFFKSFNKLFESNLIFINSFWFSLPITFVKLFNFL